MTLQPLRWVVRVFRIGRSALITAGAAIALGSLGYPWAALGVWIGLALFVGNVLLLHEVARSLASAQGRWAGRLMAMGSSVGRLMLMGVLLAGVAMCLGKEALLGACGGLLVAQVNLALPRMSSTEAI